MMGYFKIGGLIFITVYLILAGIGMLRPKSYLRLIKGQMKFYGKITGFNIEAKSDDIVCKRIQIWHSVCFVWGLFFLFLYLKFSH